MTDIVNINSLWEYKYAPKNINELILNSEIKPKLTKALETLPNLMLYGIHGIGKSAYTNILLDYTGLRDNGSMWINASSETGIDVIRERVEPFATTMGLTPIKIMVLNEGDSLTSSGLQCAQLMLKQLMEDVQKTCRFILLCNNEHRVIDELKSRFRVIKIDAPPKKEIFNRCIYILKAEKIKYKNKTVLSILNKCYPDIRKTIGVLQENTIDNILIGDYLSSSEGLFREILDSMKNSPESCVVNIRRILKNNYIPYTELYTYLYENCEEFKLPGIALVLINDHLVWNSTVANKEINFLALVIKILNNKVV